MLLDTKLHRYIYILTAHLHALHFNKDIMEAGYIFLVSGLPVTHIQKSQMSFDPFFLSWLFKRNGAN